MKKHGIMWKKMAVCAVLTTCLGTFPVSAFAADDAASITGNESYDQIIGKYIDGMNAKWNVNEFIQNDLCFLAAFGSDLNGLGYYMTDLDSDGTEELLIGQIREEGSGAIYQLFTMDGAEAKTVFSAGERKLYGLCKDNVICLNCSSNGDLSYTSFYDYKAGELVLRETVVFDAEYDPENPWFYSTTSSWEDYSTPLTEEEAHNRINVYEHVEIPFIPFSKAGSVQGEVFEDESEGWKKAYIDYIETNGRLEDSFGDFIDIYKLVDIDGDEVPELYANFGSTASGDVLCTYSNGKIAEQRLWNYGFSYIEGENLFADFGGMMDNYYNKVYCIKDGEIVLLHSGEYGAADNSQIQTDADGNPIYDYKWNGSEVSSGAEYESLFNEVYDKQMAVNPFDEAEYDSGAGRYIGNGLCDYYEIMDAVNNY